MTWYHSALAKGALAEGDKEIAKLRAEIKRLRADLAEVDAPVATHQHTIDAREMYTWPKESVLRKAIDRHTNRHLQLSR